MSNTNPISAYRLELRSAAERQAASSSRRTAGVRPLLVAAAAAVVLALGAGVAVADNVGAFGSIAAFIGISSADHAQTAQDALADEAAIQAKAMNGLVEHLDGGSVVPDTSRLVGALPDGSKLYLVATTTGDLCMITSRNAMCGPPLSSAEPTTLNAFGPADGTGTQQITWGVTQDDVIAVSFMSNGHDVTVPVVNNVWTYVGDNDGSESLTVRYADGGTQTITP